MPPCLAPWLDMCSQTELVGRGVALNGFYVLFVRFSALYTPLGFHVWNFQSWVWCPPSRVSCRLCGMPAHRCRPHTLSPPNPQPREEMIRGRQTWRDSLSIVLPFRYVLPTRLLEGVKWKGWRDVKETHLSWGNISVFEAGITKKILGSLNI